MMMTAVDCHHEFVAIPMEEHCFAQRCEWCGHLQPCTFTQLQRFLESCEYVRTQYNWERMKAKSKDSEKAFQKGLELKDGQIAWLQDEIKRRLEK